jgi:DMSO reductase anchor subunit
MHPEMSLVLLTVLAGAGEGLFIILVILNALLYKTGTLPEGFTLYAGSVSMALIVAGGVASTLHLGTPSRGWKAIVMLKNSWLSREIVSLSLSGGLLILYVVSSLLGLPGTHLMTIGVAGIAAGVAFYISCAMVYASIRFIREWSNVFTPLNFTVFGITSGIAICIVLLYMTGADQGVISGVNILLLILGGLSLILKTLSYRHNLNLYVPISIKNAMGINDPDIKIIYTGSSYDHFNTKEYTYPASEGLLKKMRALVIVIAFIVPLIIWSFTLTGQRATTDLFLVTTAAILMLSGLIIERWLFFSEGNHLQNIYYGNFRKPDVKNPLLTRSRR